MKSIIRWTAEEEEILVQAVKANPQNLSQAFRNASEQLPFRTYASVALRWYRRLNNPESPHYIGTCFVLLSSNKKSINSKVDNTQTKTTKNKISIWKKIKKLLGI